MRLKLPPQIFRLVVLTIVIVVVYLTARNILTPKSFGQYGWYRGAALKELASREPLLAGRQACDECHSASLEDLAKFNHRTLSCETCHGVAKAHVEDPENKLTQMSTDLCIRCHHADPSKPAWMKQIVVSEHYTDDSCLDCHSAHKPNEDL